MYSFLEKSYFSDCSTIKAFSVLLWIKLKTANILKWSPRVSYCVFEHSVSDHSVVSYQPGRRATRWLVVTLNGKMVISISSDLSLDENENSEIKHPTTHRGLNTHKIAYKHTYSSVIASEVSEQQRCSTHSLEVKTIGG